jgi:hypothetical protein
MCDEPIILHFAIYIRLQSNFERIQYHPIFGCLPRSIHTISSNYCLLESPFFSTPPGQDLKCRNGDFPVGVHTSHTLVSFRLPRPLPDSENASDLNPVDKCRAWISEYVGRTDDENETSKGY